MPIKNVVKSLLLVIALLGISGCSIIRKPVAVVPPTPREAPSLAQNLPLSHTAIPPAIKGLSQAKLDPVVQVIVQAEAAFHRGEREYNAGHMEAAKEEFNQAIQGLLQAPDPVVADKRLLKKLDFLVARIHAYELEALKQGDGFTEQFYEPAPLDEMATITIPEDISAAELQKIAQEDLANTVSDLPLVVNRRVAALIKYFCCTRRGRETLEGGLRRSGRYRDMILRILKEEGVPQDLIYLAQAESSFHPTARSRAAAVGLWQFIRSTGKLYGLERTWWVDNRLDPEKATRAAAKHLKDLYEMFGDWYLAMAAYNTGPRNVKRAIRRTGSRDFWKLAARRALFRETRTYVPIILALTIINKNPEKYGLGDILPEPPLAYDTIAVEHPVDLRLVSEIVGSSLKTIRELNSSLLRMTTPNVPKFNLQIPLATQSLFQRRIAMVPPDKRVWWRWHTVHYGETLTGIAKKFKTSVKAIAEVNNLDADERLQEAAELVIPVTRQQPPGGTHQIRPRETLSVLARRYNVSVAQLMMWNQLDSTVIRAGSMLHVGPPTAPPPGSGTYRVRRGDSLSRIAGRYRVNVPQLMAWNQLSSALIHPGQTLRVGTSTPASASSPSSTISSTTARSAQPNALRNNSATSRSRGRVVHRVRKGESLWIIATNYNTSVKVLKRTNSHLGRVLQIGDRVVIPASR